MRRIEITRAVSGGLALAAVAISLTAASPALSGDKIGNGGGIWACMKGHELVSGTLVDLFEAREEFGYPIVAPSQSDPLAIAEERRKRLAKEVPELESKLASHYGEVLSLYQLVNAKIIEIEDAAPRLEPLPSLCPEGAWKYEQIANFTHDGRLMIRKDYWQSSRIPSVDKAALLWHEAAYRWLRTEFGDLDSIRARRITGLVMSELPASTIRQDLAKTLAQKPLPTPAPQPTPPANSSEKWICLIENQHIKLLFGAYGSVEKIAKSRAMQACKAGPEPFFCQAEMHARCEEQGMNQEEWFCRVENKHESKTFSATGRSRLEAEYLARRDCLSQSNDRFFCEDKNTADCSRL